LEERKLVIQYFDSLNSNELLYRENVILVLPSPRQVLKKVLGSESDDREQQKQDTLSHIILIKGIATGKGKRKTR
jgi:hypothetical protein